MLVMESFEPPEQEPTDRPPRLPVRQPKQGWSLGAIIGGILGAVLVLGGLFVVGMFVFLAVGLSHWGSNK